ncbi:23S rRNA (pseudouridine(1915)-N(3))-methyltransferase RlmH [Consotaella salsifontis]|uniref:Ribosomal RNA large subunit methyltransferase H n=1 Tax=Consotaella salsifontis TaxID=1365950 RepID=A0A1T4RX48_9HYPH|nr:23S rRNA (pseudouridine(1915)-N(3))-methyltransferase RlmH [Consotaella salsifontis]SKA20436.1 23S rRNA (pseudouridine1915-N3)-methyltransferase [Consotaella salsifontis]
MKLTIAAVGRMKSGPERELAERYLARLKKTGGAVALDYAGLVELPEGRGGTADERKRDEAARLAAAVGESAVVIALDERGKTLSSEEFASDLAGRRDAGARDLALLIGGPDGLADSLRQRADLTLSFGRMTLPHQLVRVVLAEQLYRAVTILSGHPYHRA